MEFGLLLLLLWSVLSTSAVQAVFSGVAEVTTSGDFRRPGPPGFSCRLPDVINVTITSGDVIIALEVSKPPRVTQDALVYVIGNDGKIRQVATDNQETHAFYRSLQSRAALRVSCPRAGERCPTVEGTVYHGGRWYHLRHGSSGLRDVTSLTSSGRGEYQLTEVAEDGAKGEAVDSAAAPDQASLSQPPPPSTPTPQQAGGDWQGQDGDSDDARAGRFHRRPPRRPRRRRRRQAVDGNNVFIDVIAVISFDVYDDAIKASEERTVAAKKADALKKIKDKYGLMVSEVDLHYGLIGDRLPYSVSINLVGFIIAETARVSPWTENLKTRPEGSARYRVDSESSLQAFSDWVRLQTSLEKADIFIAYTDYDLTNTNSGTSNLGYAFLGGVCGPTLGGNAAIVESHFFTLAVMISVHELGHTFGAKHDGEGNTCQASDQYIMAPSVPPRTAPNYSRFSSCSLDYFNSTFSKRAATTEGDACLHETLAPDPGLADFTGVAPGQLTDAQAQCRDRYGNTSGVCEAFTTIGDPMCQRTMCRDPSLGPGFCNSISLLRGTSCGDKKWCFNALCVEDPAAPSKDEKCLFGNKREKPYPGDDRTCEDVVAAAPYTCYGSFFGSQCCDACNAIKLALPDCLYGDKSAGCRAALCATYNQTELDRCCGTCTASTTTTPTTTTPTTTTPTTTTPTTTTPTTTTPTTTTPTTTTPTTTTPTTTTPTTTTPTTTTPTTTTPTTTTPTTTTPTTTTPTTTTPTTTTPTTTTPTTTTPTTTTPTTTTPTTTSPTTTTPTTTTPTTTTPTTTTPTTTTPTTTTPTNTTPTLTTPTTTTPTNTTPTSTTPTTNDTTTTTTVTDTTSTQPTDTTTPTPTTTAPPSNATVNATLTTPGVSEKPGQETMPVLTQAQLIGILVAAALLFTYYFSGCVERGLCILFRIPTLR